MLALSLICDLSVNINVLRASYVSKNFRIDVSMQIYSESDDS